MKNTTVQLKELAISESGLIFEPSSGVIFISNGIGVQILRALYAGKTTAEITESLCTEYNVKKETAQRDLQDFLTQLRGYGHLYE